MLKINVLAVYIVYMKALELWEKGHPTSPRTPIVEELKKEGYWGKALEVLELNPKDAWVPHQLQYENRKLKEYEEKLKQLTYHLKPSEVEMEKLIPSTVLPPRQLGDIKEFADSIGKISLLAPLILRSSTKKQGFYEIVCGHRRFEALKLKGITKVQARIFEVLPDEYVFKVNADENWYHKGLSGAEWAIFFDKWKKTTGWSQVQIAKSLGVTEQLISEYLSLLKLPEDVQSLNAFKFLTLNMGLQLKRMKDSKKQIEVMRKINRILQENPNITSFKLSKEFTRILKQHKEGAESATEKSLNKFQRREISLEDYFIERLHEMMESDSRTQEAFRRYFVEACDKAELSDMIHFGIFYEVQSKISKRIDDFSFRINFVGDEILVDVDKYKLKFAGSIVKDEIGGGKFEKKPIEEWRRINLLFKGTFTRRTPFKEVTIS